MAAVDTRTGKVLWEAWRLDEIPASASKEEKTAVEYLLGLTRDSQKPLPRVTLLPEFPVKDLVIKNPWPEWRKSGGIASEGKSLIYYRTGTGVITLDRQTKKEAWRLETTRYPYSSYVLEPGENLAFIQIGSDIPATIHTSLVGGGRTLQMRGLEPHTLKQRAAAAVLLHHYGDGYLRPEVQKLVELLRKETDDPAAVTVAKVIEKLLADWPKTRDRRRLFDGSVATLLGAEGDPFKDFAWPGAQRVLAWCLLQELIYGSPKDGYSRQGYNYAYHTGWEEQPVSMPEATKTKLADHCRKVAAEGSVGEKPFAASVLVSTAVGWARLTDAERKKLFLSSDPSAWRWAALALVKNGRSKELMEWSRERPANDHLDVIWVTWGRQIDKPKKWSDGELEFWVAVARHDAGGVAYVLSRCDGTAPTEFREPIRAYLSREIAKPTVKDSGTQPSYSLYAALTVLDAWKNADDTTLLLEYLKHPAGGTDTRLDGERKTEVRSYQLRLLARGLLEKRGVRVPPGVVYEEVVGPGKE